MYDELKEKCRACSQGCIYPSECSYFEKPPFRCMRQLLSEAADAIEQLQYMPPHGRLIDADEALKKIKPIVSEDCQNACTIETTKRLMIKLINDAPTVIVANR